MSERRQKRVNELFARALELQPEDRARYIDAVGTTRTRGELEALLDAHASMDDFLQRTAPDRFVPPEFRRLDAGEQVGAYRVIRLLGEGGGGAVYEAEQESPRRRVALKVGHFGLHPGSERRFREEADILARMEHPRIAHVYEAGVHGGLPYFALEYVSNAETIRAHGRRLDRRALLRLFADVCDAVHHGHQRGVIHRDLKPQNILVDQAGQPKVIDFGIARAVGAEPDGSIVGTPAYMSPEQCVEGRSLDVRTDVYSLGLILYELLVGSRPYDVSGMPLPEARRVIETCEPAWSEVELGADLEAVLRRALSKRHEDRYSSAAALADDLRRHLEFRPVEARPATPWVSISRFARRQRFAFGAAATLVLVCIASAVGGTWLAIEKERQRQAADVARARSERQRYLTDVGAAASALRGRDLRAARAHLARAPEHHRGWEWHFLSGRLERGDGVLRWEGARVRAAAIHPDGSKIVVAGNQTPAGRRLRIWTLDTGGAEEFDLPGHAGVESLAYSPDGSILAVGRVRSGQLALYDATSREEIGLLPGHTGHVTTVTFRPDGSQLASSSYDGTIRVWDIATRAPVAVLRGHEGKVFCVDFDASGRRLASGGEDGTIRFWDPATGTELRRVVAHDRNVECIRFGDGGTKLVSGGIDGAVCVLDVERGSILRRWRNHSNFVKSVDFHRDGRRVVSGSLDRSIRVFDLVADREVARHVGHSGWIYDVRFHPDGQRIFSAALDGSLRSWRIESEGDAPELRGHARAVTRLRFTRDGSRLLSIAADGECRLWDPRRPDAIAVHTPDAAAAPPLRFEPLSDQRVVRVGDERMAGVTRTGHVLPTTAVLPDGRIARRHPDHSLRIEGGTGAGRHSTPFRLLAASPDGRFLATWAPTGIVRVWRVDPLVEVARMDGFESVTALAVGSDRLALSTTSGASLIDWPAQREVARLGKACRCLAFSPDGTRLAGAEHETIQLWDAADGQSVLVFDAHPLYVGALAWSPDGRSLASGGGDHFAHACTIRVWSATSPAARR